MNLFQSQDVNLEFYVVKHKESIGKHICNDNNAIIWSTIYLFYHLTVHQIAYPAQDPVLDEIHPTLLKSNYKLKCALNKFIVK